MANPEGLRRGTFGITPTKERTAPTIPGDRPPPVSPEPGKPPKPRKKLSTKARIALAGLAVLGTVETTGAAVQEQINHQPISTRTIVTDITWPLKAIDNLLNPPKIEVPAIFDNKLDTGVIEASILTRLPQTKIDQQFPTAFAKLDDGRNTLELLSPLRLETSSDPNAKIRFKKSFHGSSLAESKKYEGKGIYDQITYQNVPGGTTIVSPIDGWLVNDKDNQPVPSNGANTKGVSINFVSPDGNQYRLVIGGSTIKDFDDGSLSRSTGYVLKLLLNAPNFKPEDNQKVIGEYGVKVKKGDRILELIRTKDNKPIEEIVVTIVVARKGEVGKPFSIDNPPIPTNLDLFVDSDGRLISPE